MKKFKKLGFNFSLAILLFFSFIINIYADYANFAGGSGGSGVGTNSNGWVVSTSSGGWKYDGEGFRVYLVSGITGIPIEGYNIIDISNSNEIPYNNIWNGGKNTKYNYSKNNKSLIRTDSYNYITISTSEKIPPIIPSVSGDYLLFTCTGIDSYVFGSYGLKGSPNLYLIYIPYSHPPQRLRKLRKF